MYKVLLVDDEILVRDAIRENLDWNGLGYELVGDCANGKEAMEYVQTHEVDVVITDINMPFVDGMELSRFLYNNYPEVAIIIFSGFGEFEYAKQAIQYKVAEYILKPVTAMELSEVLTRLKDKLDHTVFQEKKIEKLQKAYHSYRKNEALIASRVLCNLVMGTQDLDTTKREMQEVGISLTGSHFRVAVVDIDHYSNQYEVDEGLKKESALMTFVVENISNEILGNHKAGLAFRDTGNRVFLILETDKPKDFIKKAKAICEEIQTSIYETMKFTVSLSLGCYVKKLSELPISYEDAMDALSYRYTLGDSMFIDCEEMDQRLDGPIPQEQYLDAIKNAVKHNNLEEITKIFADMENGYRSSYVKRDRIVMYLQQINRELCDLITRINGAENSETTCLPLSEIMQCKNAQEAVEKVLQFALSVAGQLSNSVSTSAQRIGMQAVDYINENYANPDLGLHHICKHLNISTSYFSSIFKETTGETFMEVLIRVRMDRAKDLLEQTTLKNYEIAERVGFSDPHYFSISFKKMTGMSPTEYAKEKRKA